MQRTGETFERRYEAELVLIELFALLVLLFLLSAGAAPSPASHSAASPVAQPAAAPASVKPVEQPAGAPVKPAARHIARRRRVVVSIPDRKLALLDKGKVVKVYPVAVGAAGSPSPSGEFTIVCRAAAPSYKHNRVFIPPGKKNPLGPRWLGLSKAHYGIHGTNDPDSIGHAASGGCIRMNNQDVEELFAQVEVGDGVEIHGQRDPGLEQIFGETTPVGASAGVTDGSEQL
ncbi:MAG TPA: L,D-transpeptidase [Terriglobales bacterium]|jgi:lipoprotein-anchoring transpeptidase ErfK/SrfK|nr:L,D-transpeptidase [Terriglobales bacterium]